MDYKEVEKKYQEVLRIRNVSLGSNHAYTAEALYKLGCCFRRLCEPLKAEQYLMQAKQIQEAKNLSVALQDTQSELDMLHK